MRHPHASPPVTGAFFPWALVALVLAVAPPLPAQTTLEIFTEDLPPYGYIENQTLRGMSVEIVQELLGRLHENHTIRVVPWARAYAQIQHTDNTVLFTMAKTPDRTPLFRWIGPLAVDKTYFYKKRDASFDLTTVESAKDFRILVTRDYPEEALVRSLGFVNTFITTDPETNWRMLLKGRGDLTVSGQNTFAVNLRKMGIPPSEFVRTGPPLFQTELDIALSLKLPDAVYDRWARTFADMEKDGTVARLRARYLPQDD